MKHKEQTPKASYGYGGKFGVEKDRMDKVNKLCFLISFDILYPLFSAYINHTL